MMSLKKFEKISGHEAQIEQCGHYVKASCVCGCDGTALRLETGHHRTDSDALVQLREMAYRRHAVIVFERQNWRCLECGRLAALQADHVKKRSQGRDDRVQNLEGKCCSCHQARHDNPEYRGEGIISARSVL